MRLGVLLMLAVVVVSGSAQAAGDWNEDGIAWRPYEEGLREAARTQKPVCLIFFTTWCPDCTNYAKVFHDPRVEKAAKDFVMIRLDKDQHAELSRKHNVDGEYIPRTYFMSPKGVVDPSIQAPRDRYRYFFPEHDPAGLLSAMGAAKTKLTAR